MSRDKPLHYDRGDQTCDWCYEEWPCASVGGETSGTGLHEWEREESRRLDRIEEQRTKIWAEELASVAESCGATELAAELRRGWLGSRVWLSREELEQILGQVDDCVSKRISRRCSEVGAELDG